MNKIQAYYDACTEDEWGRLERDPFHHLEWRATLACLRAHLPSMGLILDAGGGPGRYTRELCRQGYDVALLDLSPKSIALAREKLAAEGPAVASHLQRCEVGDVRDLSRFSDQTFDAVLCLGPLSHLTSVEDRRKAISELVRVAKPGAPVIVAVIGFYAVLCVVLKQFSSELTDPARCALYLTGDQHTTGPGFPDAHFFRPEELQSLAEEAGLHTAELRACEGLSANLSEATNALREHDDGRWEQWLKILDATQHDPAVVATSQHFLYVGRTPAGHATGVR